MTQRLLNDEIVQQVQQIFTRLKEPVEVLYFGSETDCEYCPDTLQLVQEVTALSDKLRLSTYDLERDAELARRYAVDKAPALVFARGANGEIQDYGIRMFGIPAGHEFGTLVHDLVLVSTGDSGLEDSTRAFLKALSQPVLLQVFVTPT